MSFSSLDRLARRLYLSGDPRGKIRCAIAPVLAEAERRKLTKPGHLGDGFFVDSEVRGSLLGI